MAFLKASDHKAIAWWAEERGLKPQLSTPPIIYFKDKNGNEVSANIASLVPLYKAWKKEQSKNNKRKVSS